MKLKAFLLRLEELKNELGDSWESTDVRVYADHGQCELLVDYAEIMHSDEDSSVYMIEGASDDISDLSGVEPPAYSFVSVSG